VDALYVNALGRLTLAEFKLWRNPQARREVIGQILDYAKEIASWSYEDLQREVSRALKRPGNVLFDLVRATDPDVEEGVFVDNVTRHLRRGEFLLLIIGDGIREGVENIVDFVQQHSGLHFNLALVEATLYVKVRNSWFGDWGLSFVGYLYRSSPHIGCYLTCRKDIPQAVRVYEQIDASLAELRRKMGDDLRTWDSNGRPRIGFQSRDGLPFGAADNSPDFQESVRWMRERLDLLVSGVYPRLQELLSGSA